MKILDLFCGGGGACEGYQRQGHAVTGIDISPQNNYPGTFVLCDAIDFLQRHGEQFDFIHASPPCQGYSKHVQSRSSQWNHTKGKDEPKLIIIVRKELLHIKKPYVIENVVGAKKELSNPILLWGSMFDLMSARHRLFETNWILVAPTHPACRGIAKQWSQKLGWEYRDMTVTGKGRNKGTSERWKQILGTKGEMTQHQLAESIPPAYTQYIISQYEKKHA